MSRGGLRFRMAWVFTARLRLLPVLLGVSLAALAQPESGKLSPLQLEEKFQQAYTIIEERYIERVQTGKLLISGITEMLRAAGLSNLKYSDVVPPTHPRGSRKDNFEAFRLAIQAIRVKTGAKVDLDTLVSAMIRGMVTDLGDGYSSYLEPEKNRELVKYLKGETESFGGVGVLIEFKDGVCKVVHPLPDTPAYRAGIRPGDVVLEVDGHPVRNQDEAVDRMKGDPGTRVAVTIRRPEIPDPLTYELVRQTIMHPEMERILLTEEVGYVRLNSFNENSAKGLAENLHFLSGMGMKKCILDLRRNSGGLLKAAVEVSEIFLPKGSLVTETRGRVSSDSRKYRTQGDSGFTQIPLVVLVDENTASAAEIVTGAIRDNRRGKAVGMTTFGKGTVQEVIPLDDESALKLTVAKYYTPSGICINSTGIKPDYTVKVDPLKVMNPALYEEPSKVDRAALAEDLQLKKALELLGVTLPLVGS